MYNNGQKKCIYDHIIMRECTGYRCQSCQQIKFSCLFFINLFQEQICQQNKNDIDADSKPLLSFIRQMHFLKKMPSFLLD